MPAGAGRYRLTYGTDSRLLVVERADLRNRTELTYNSEGQVFLERRFEKRGDENWVEASVFTYTYTNGKITGINENYPSMGLLFDKEVVWEGGDIGSIITRSNNTIQCTQHYRYDLSAKNPVAPLVGLYYRDNFRGTFKLSLYSSASRLLQEENTCPAASITNIGYELNSQQLL